MHYFPEPGSPEIASFVKAFVRLMFAHAEFERRVCDLQGVITGDPQFGEQHKNQWSARDRPKKITTLISKEQERLGDVPELGNIVSALETAISHCERRNLLAHGTWWRFDPVQQVITVRSATDWPDREQHVDLTACDIDAAADALRILEVEIDRLTASIRERLRDDGF